MSIKNHVESQPTLGDALICAGCGEQNTHTHSVDVYERKEELKEGLHVTVKDMQVSVDQEVAVGNPSSRRDGIVIKFWCEHCDTITHLNIAQHKGTTYLDIKAE